MTGSRNLFVELDESFKPKVKFADNNIISAEGRGNVLVQLKSGDYAYILDVLYAPVMKNKLLSLGQLLEKNYTMRLDNRALHVINENKRVILKVPLYENRMFKIDINTRAYKCLVAIVIDEN